MFGTDLDRLYMIGNRIKAATEGIEGLVDVQVEQQMETPQLHIVPNRALLAKHRITVGDLERAAQTGGLGQCFGARCG